LLALYVREAYILSYDGATTAALYCFVSFVFSLLAFAAFGVRDGMPRYFSVHDAIDLAKAVLVAELLTCVVLFTFTRLEGIPRSTPVIHALILVAGLVTARGLARIADKNRKVATGPRHVPSEYIILIGLNELSSLYMKILEAFAPGQRRVIAILDERPSSIGRSVNGVRVFGPPAQLGSLVDEFAVHGMMTHRIVVGGDPEMLSHEAMDDIRHVCVQRGLDLEFVPQLLGLNRERTTKLTPPFDPMPAAAEYFVPSIALPSYFRFKNFADFFAALLLIIALLPVWIVVAALAFVDVRSPIHFWQQRVGLNGRQFLLYKFRTLQLPLDWRGHRVADDQRLSWIGELLRKTRLDELPQLLNVLVGDMSLIGPRPLLPQDQPSTTHIRLMVRPGITGWAQVNGGRLLSAEEKDALDEWYIRNASLWLDVRIFAMTVLCLARGDRRSETALARARGMQPLRSDGATARGQGGSSHLSIPLPPAAE